MVVLLLVKLRTGGVYGFDAGLVQMRGVRERLPCGLVPPPQARKPPTPPPPPERLLHLEPPRTSLLGATSPLSQEAHEPPTPWPPHPPTPLKSSSTLAQKNPRVEEAAVARQRRLEAQGLGVEERQRLWMAQAPWAAGEPNPR